MSTAVIATGGRQYRVKPGDVVRMERLHAGTGPYTFERVLLVEDAGDVQVGAPTVAGVSVAATVLGDAKGPKLHVATYRAKKRTRRAIGHRQRYTSVRIDAIQVPPRHGANAVDTARERTMSATRAASAAKPKAKAKAKGKK